MSQLRRTTRRFRITRVATNPDLFHPLFGYRGFHGFNKEFIYNTIREKLKVKPKAILRANYYVDIFDLSNIKPLTKYEFFDVLEKDIQENADLDFWATLLRENQVNIIISENETWNLSLQDKSINLLKDSYSSETTHVLPWDHLFNPNLPRKSDTNLPKNEDYNYYAEEWPLINPFCANEEEPGPGYRDAYTSYLFEENIN